MGSHGHQKMLRKCVEKGFLTEDEYRGMICGNGGRINPVWAEWFMGYQKEFTNLIPTPSARMYKGSSLKRYPGGNSTEAIWKNC
jgi:hypothetical protein